MFAHKTLSWQFSFSRCYDDPTHNKEELTCDGQGRVWDQTESSWNCEAEEGQMVPEDRLHILSLIKVLMRRGTFGSVASEQTPVIIVPIHNLC